MEGSSKKFRLANLMVNLGTGELLKPCYITKCRIFKSELPCRLPSQGCFKYFSPCGFNSPCGIYSPCGANSPCGALRSLYEEEAVPCAAGSRIPDYLDMYKHTPIIIEEIDDLEVIVELKNDLQVALKAIKIQEEALTSAYQPKTLEEAEHLELELKKALKVVEEMKGKLPGRK